jgi:hypothetical protein
MTCADCPLALVCLGENHTVMRQLRYCGYCHALILTEVVRRHEELTTIACPTFVAENAATWKPADADPWDPFDPYEGDRFLHGLAINRFHAGIDCPRCCPGAWAEPHVRHYADGRYWNYTQWTKREQLPRGPGNLRVGR